MSSPASSTLSIPESFDDIEIRPLTAADIPNVCELHSSLLPYVHYPASFFRQSLFLSDRLCLVAYSHENPDVPVAVVSTFNDESKVEVLTVAVQPQYQRRGLGRRLIRQAIANLTNDDESGVYVTAHASVANQAACDFYERGLGLSHDEGIIYDMYRKSPAGGRDAYRFMGRI